MQERNNETYRYRALMAAEAAQAADAMGHRDIAQAYRNIQAMWLRLARQSESLTE
jgi:hypothetical protein